MKIALSFTFIMVLIIQSAYLLLKQTKIEFLHPAIANLDARQQDMRSFMDLRPSILESLRYTKRKRQEAYAIDNVTWGDISYSLQKLLTVLPEIDGNIAVLRDTFEFVPVHSHEEPMQFTGYYHPTLVASRTYQEGWTPIYRMPQDRKKFSRKAIDEGALAGKNLEIAWVKDKFEAFLLEVQGSGCLEYTDGSFECVRYAGQNGKKYKSSRRILEEKGLLIASDINEQRQFFTKHPEYLPLLNENPSYVFFEKTSETRAIGAMGRPIHSWQSIAVDRRKIPLGSIVSIQTNLLDSPYAALVLAQDTGGAIKGRRIDIFCGSDTRGATVAATLNESGKAWILLAKDRPGKIPQTASDKQSLCEK